MSLFLLCGEGVRGLILPAQRLGLLKNCHLIYLYTPRLLHYEKRMDINYLHNIQSWRNMAGGIRLERAGGVVVMSVVLCGDSGGGGGGESSREVRRG